MKIHIFVSTTEWKVSYAWKKCDEIGEGEIVVQASNIADVYNEAKIELTKIGLQHGWDQFSIWDIGIIEDIVI